MPEKQSRFPLGRQRSRGWSAPEIYWRADTPLHSLLHEAGHFICMDDGRRDQLHKDAGGDYDEENGVCYLQIVLAGELPGVGRSERMFRGHGRVGLTFRTRLRARVVRNKTPR